MKTNDLTKAVLAALLLASPLAGAESQYPAANFEPVIITQDADLIAKHSQAAKERNVAEQPKPGATSSQAATASTSTKQANAATETAPPSPTPKEESSMEIFPIVLVVLALGGLVFWNSRKSGSVAQEVSAAPVAVSGGTGAETGVAKYLKSLPEAAKSAETGVAKYLKSLPPKVTAPAETGVAKYLKVLPEKAAPAETGVAKYLKTMPPKAASAETGVAKYLKNLDVTAG